MSKNEKKSRREVESKFPDPTSASGWGQETFASDVKTEGRDKAVFTCTEAQLQLASFITLPQEADLRWDFKHFTQQSELPTQSDQQVQAEPNLIPVPVDEVQMPVLVPSIPSPTPRTMLLPVVSITPSKVSLPPGSSY